MGRNSAPTKDKKKYVEFNYSEGANTASGRVWLDNQRETEKSISTGLSLNINGLVIVGASLVHIKADGRAFISFPSYKTTAGDFKNLVFMVDEDDLKFLEKLASEIAKLL